MARYRVRDATLNIPAGLIVDIDKLEQGGIASIPGYRFVIDKVITSGDSITIANSNVIAIVDPLDN